MLRHFPLVSIFLAAALGTSCSKLSIGVYWADTFVMRSLDDYFLLNSDASAQAKTKFTETFKAVRREDFPKLVALLERLAEEAEQNRLSGRKLENWMQDSEQVIRAALARFEPLGQFVVAEQVANQFSRFDQEFKESYEKRKKNLESAEEREEMAQKNMERLLKETIETLSPEQEAVVKAFLKESPPPVVLQNESRKFVHEAFQKARVEKEGREAFVRRFFTDWIGLQSPAYQAARRKYQDDMRAMLTKVFSLSSTEQRENLARNFRGRAKELRSLSVGI